MLIVVFRTVVAMLIPIALAVTAVATGFCCCSFWFGFTDINTITPLLVGLDFVTKLGIGSALGVLTTVLISISLLLAVLALFAYRIDLLKVPLLRGWTTRRRPARRHWSRVGARS